MIELKELIKNETIALAPGGYKPFHIGHYNMVMSIPANKVLLFVSTKDKHGLSYENSIKIIDLYKEVFPEFAKKVEVSDYSLKYPSPVTAMYELLRSGKLSGKTLILAKSDKDIVDKRFQLYKKYADEGNVKVKVFNFKASMEQEDTVSSSKIMNLVNENKINSALNFFPKKLVDLKKNELVAILRSAQNNKPQIKEYVLSEGIKHIEDLKPNELLDLLNSWNIGDKEFEVTEKVDGRSLNFGVDSEGFHISSKTKKFRSETEYPSLYFYDDFKKYHTLLQNIDFLDIIQKVLNSNDIQQIEFFGEAIASYDSNIVLYDKSIIGEGVYIVFGIKADGESLNTSDINNVTKEINKQSEIKFYPNFIVDTKNIKFEEKYITTLKTIIEKYGNILSKPVRNPLDKALKEKVKKIINLIGKKSKETFLGKMSNYKSPLGGDIEGYVVKLPDGNLVKIVDKNKFTKEKMQNWKYIEEMGNLYKKFTSELKKNANSLKPEFELLMKQSLKLYDEFKNGGQSEFTIPKKINDTIESFKIHFNRLNAIKALLDVESNDILVDKILNKQINESDNIIVEGGKTFPNMKAIKNEYVIPTTKFCLKNLNMEGLQFALTGNYKKALLGDIDLAVDAKELADIIGSRFDSLEDKDKFFEDLKTYIDKNKTNNVIDYKINKGLQQFSVAVPAVDDKNKFIPDTDVQLDVMIGDREWMRRALGPANNSQYKAAHRNFLYTAAFSQIEMVTDNVDVKRKYQFNMKQGVDIVDFTFDGKGKRVKLGKSILTGNVEDMVHILFDDSVLYDDVNSFEKLYHMMLTDKFKYPELRNDIFREFVKTVKNMKLQVPDEIKKYE